MAADPYWSGTVLGLHFEGAHGSTTILDSKNHIVVPNGNAIISTAQAKYGTGSLYLDGASDWVSIPGSQDFVFGMGDFTLEAWVRSTDTQFCIFDFYVSGQNAWQLTCDASGKLRWYGNSSLLLTSTGASVNTGAWVHTAVTRESGVVRLFVDGVVNTATVTDNTNYNTQQTWLSIGAQVNSRNSAYDLLGYVDNVRITKGVARYTATFTPDDFTDNPAYFVSGVVHDNAGNGVARTVRGYRRDTGALIGTTVSNASTGAYTLELTYGGEVQVVMLDADADPVENDQILRTVAL